MSRLPPCRRALLPGLLSLLLGLGVSGCEIDAQPDSPGDLLDVDDADAVDSTPGALPDVDIPDTAPTPEAFGRAYRAALCEIETRCGLGEVGGDGDPCADAALPGQGGHEQVPDAITIDATDAAHCLGWLAGLDCDRDLVHAVQAVCRRAVVGQLTRDAPCTHDLECAEADSWCDDTPSGGCACLAPTFTRPATALLGDPCTQDSMCTTSRCLAGACALPEPIEPDEPGEPCGIHWDVSYSDCGPGLYCPSDMDGYCELLVDDLPSGADCDYARTCAYPLACIGGTCAQRRTLGESCSQGGCETSLYCFEGTCRPRKADGEPCDDFELPPTGGPGAETERNLFSMVECRSGECVEGICGQTTFCGP